MGKPVVIVVFVVALVAAVVCVDVVFFRNNFGERLIANICIVAAFIAFYFLFLRNG